MLDPSKPHSFQDLQKRSSGLMLLWTNATIYNYVVNFGSTDIYPTKTSVGAESHYSFSLHWLFALCINLIFLKNRKISCHLFEELPKAAYRLRYNENIKHHKSHYSKNSMNNISKAYNNIKHLKRGFKIILISRLVNIRKTAFHFCLLSF